MDTRHPDQPIRWSSRTISPPGHLAALRQAVAANRGGVMLESVPGSGPGGRYSVFAIDPVRTAYRWGEEDADCFSLLGECWRPWRRLAGEPALPLVGGWIGMLSYEAGRFTEPSAGWRRREGSGPRKDSRPSDYLPLAHWSLFDTVLVHDGGSDCWTVAGLELPGDVASATRPPLEARLRRLERFVERIGDGGSVVHNDRISHATGRWNLSRDRYFRMVERALAYIRAGDIFQVNLARRFGLATAANPVAIYQRLCEWNPAAFAAYLPIHQARSEKSHPAAVLSSSPELFLRLRGSEVVTRPIKGTRPRGCDVESDAAAALELSRSRKDRAELNMIIDLERNDLGRVCEYGSVRVESDGEIERLATVFHRTATIRGRLRPGLDAVDLLRATFPGGSVTGAPKVRAMQIINELEPDARGPYCGAIGYVGLDGTMQMNLAIRTLTMAGGCVDCFVGSAIVSDSEPNEEYLELKAKVAGMMAALGVGVEQAPAPVSAGPSLESF